MFCERTDLVRKFVHSDLKFTPSLSIYYLAGRNMKSYPILIFIMFATFCSFSQEKSLDPAITDTFLVYLQSLHLSKTVKIKEIQVHGNEVTRRTILLREMNINEAEIILTDSIPDLISENTLRLRNLSLFNEIDMRIEMVSADEIIWHIHVKERWYIIPEVSVGLADRNFNQWWVEQHHNINRINFVLAAEDKNFRGNLETLTAFAQIGYTQKFLINYMRPYINKAQKSGLGFTASYSTNRQIFYETDSNKQVYAGTYTSPILLRQAEATISYYYRPAYAVRHIFQFGYRDYKVADTVLQLNKNYFADSSTHLRMLEFVYRLEVNHVDNWDYPLHGNKLVLQASSRIGFEGIKFQNLVTLEAGIFRNPSYKWFFTTIFRGRLMLPQQQPYALTEGLGFMANYVRGYEYYVVNGSNYGILRFDLKRELFNHTFNNIPIKYLTAFPLRIYPKIFTDIGAINTLYPAASNSFLSNQLLYAFGVGVDIITAYDLKIRLEFAYNGLNQKGLYLHTSSE